MRTALAAGRPRDRDWAAFRKPAGKPCCRKNTGVPRRLRDRLVDQPRQVQRELILAADAIEQVVEDAPAAAEDRLVVQLVDDADARREVVAVRLDQAAVLQRAVVGEHQAAAAGRVELVCALLASSAGVM